METALKETEGKLVNLPDKKFDSAEFLKNLPHLARRFIDISIKTVICFT